MEEETKASSSLTPACDALVTLSAACSPPASKTASTPSRSRPLPRTPPSSVFSPGEGDGSAQKKKQCNCKFSQCLKLYCECFASGVYCVGCNCQNCHNNIHFEAIRKEAIQATLDRNPSAFRPKIASSPMNVGILPVDAAAGKHNKGCHCKKSGCFKKYCECFQAGVYCSDNCKCQMCKNHEPPGDRKLLTASSELPSQSPHKRPRPEEAFRGQAYTAATPSPGRLHYAGYDSAPRAHGSHPTLMHRRSHESPAKPVMPAVLYPYGYLLSDPVVSEMCQRLVQTAQSAFVDTEDAAPSGSTTTTTTNAMPSTTTSTESEDQFVAPVIPSAHPPASPMTTTAAAAAAADASSSAAAPQTPAASHEVASGSVHSTPASAQGGTPTSSKVSPQTASLLCTEKSSLLSPSLANKRYLQGEEGAILLETLSCIQKLVTATHPP